jgi:FixJ family two-component response regulator
MYGCQGLSGLDLQRIIFIAGYGNVPMTVWAMKAGAIEFLTKPFCGQDVLDAIQQARPPGGRGPRWRN